MHNKKIGGISISSLSAKFLGNLFSALAFIALSFALSSFMAGHAFAAIGFVQLNYATPQTPQSTVALKFTNTQTAGNLNVIVVGWNDTTAVVNSVSDTSGNIYTRAVGPTARTGQLTQSIYYAKNIAGASANSNTVTVQFSTTAQYADIRAIEYSGIDTTNPVDITAAGSGVNSSSNSGAATTTNANDLIFGANIVSTTTGVPGTGFTNRVITIPDGDIAEDRVVSAIGSYSATAPLTSAGPWVMQMVAFRAATAIADTTPPTAPSALSATAAGSTTVNLAWTASTDNVGVANYRIERCSGAACTTFAQVATSVGPTFSDTTVAANTSYSYRVRAADAAGNLSGYSNVSSVTTPAIADTTPPTASSALSATAAGSTTVNLAWTASTDNVGVANYRIERCSGAACTTFAQVGTSVGPTFSDTTGITANTSYSYRVRAADAAGNLSGYSNVSSVTTPAIADTTPPTAPSALSATAAGSTTVNLAWTASTDNVGVANYRIERCSGVACTTFAQVATSVGTTFSDTTVTANTSYSYRVRAADAAGNLSGYSNVSTTKTAQTTAPIAFIQQNYSVPQTPQTTVTLPFTKAQVAGDLNIVVVGWANSTSVVNAVTDSKGNVYNLAVGPTTETGIHAQSIYYAKNIASANAGTNSVTVTFDTAAPYPDIRILEYSGLDPVNPVDVIAAAASTSITSSTPTTATTNANDLIFGANTVQTTTGSPGVGFTNRVITAPDGNIAEDMVVTTVGNYNATAQLSSSGGWVMQMVAFRAPGNVTDQAPPTTPTNLVSTTPGSGVINLTWSISTDNIGVMGYRVERCQGTGCTNFAQVAVTPSTNYADNGILGAIDYSYRVLAVDTAGNPSGYSNIATTITVGPAQIGSWGNVINWPLVAVHAALLPNGKVLAYDSDTSGTTGSGASVFDPATSTFTAVPYATKDLFCSGLAELPDGRVFIAGGHNDNYIGINTATTFISSPQSWADTKPMTFARWYPTVTALPDGRMLVTSGSIDSHANIAAIPEIYNPANNTWTQLTSASLALPLYPHMFVIPDGRVLVTGSYEQKVVARTLNLNTQTWTTVDPVAVEGGSAAMYLPGKVITSGLGTAGGANVTGIPSASTTYVLDMTSASPAWRQTGAMAFQRDYHTLTMLPDGNVLATGGGQTTGATDASTAVLEAEVWSPVTESWTKLAAMQVPRLYHSTALLLPDGRVLVAGGGRNNGAFTATGPTDNLNAEIFSPPYLNRGARPTISSAPSSIQYGSNFFVGTTATDISSVSFIRLGAATHAFNMNQLFMPLTFTQTAGGLNILAPNSPNLAPPGVYMMFILNSDGVPSIASVMSIH